MNKKLIRFLFYFLIILLLVQLFSPKPTQETNTTDQIILTSKSSFTMGNEVIVSIQNKEAAPITIKSICPKNPLTVEYEKNSEWVKKEAELSDPSYCSRYSDITIDPQKTGNVRFGLWTPYLFDQPGQYRVSYETTDASGKAKTFSHEFSITTPSFLGQVWTTLLYRPIFNILIFLLSNLPGHNLGLAIILLTLLIKLILLIPNQKALKSQRQLQIVQPQLDALKEKYKNDPQKLAQETMEIWKKHKVSPLGSCLPMLIQFPILIALFYVVRDSFNVMDPHLFYDPLKNFTLNMINPIFLGLDLTKINFIFLPVLVGGLQFLQIKLSFAKLKNSGSGSVPMLNNVTQYLLPLMIAFFTASLPAAVGFYWGISTIFAIGQQLVVNYSKNNN